MALWALGMLVVSTLMMLVSALGVWWIRDTLNETRRAVKAADDAVTATRDIGEAQTRAYVSQLNISSDFHKSAAGVDCVAFIMHWQNTGNSPAMKLANFVKVQTLNTSTEHLQVENFLERPAISDAIRQIPAGGNINSMSAPLLIEGHLAGWLAGQKDLLIWSRCEWEDVFGRRWFIEVCNEMKPLPSDGDVPFRFSFKTYPHHNGYGEIE